MAKREIFFLFLYFLNICLAREFCQFYNLPSVQNGFYLPVLSEDPLGLENGQKIAAECKPGFTMLGNGEAKCEFGRWSQSGQCYRQIGTSSTDYPRCFEKSDTKLMTSTLSNHSIGNIPNYNEIVLYLLFDKIHGSVDFINGLEPAQPGLLLDLFPGPFQRLATSYSSCENCHIGPYKMQSGTSLTAFTIGMYWRTSGDVTSGILTENINQASWYLRYSILSVNLDLEFHIHPANEYGSSPKTIRKIRVDNFFERNKFKFFYITYNIAEDTLRIRDGNGVTRTSKQNVNIYIAEMSSIIVGYGSRDGVAYQMSPKTAIACLSIHKAVLDQASMGALQCACEGAILLEKNENNEYIPEKIFGFNQFNQLLLNYTYN